MSPTPSEGGGDICSHPETVGIQKHNFDLFFNRDSNQDISTEKSRLIIKVCDTYGDQYCLGVLQYSQQRIKLNARTAVIAWDENKRVKLKKKPSVIAVVG